ncbi:MAG TPA: acyl-CoA dehydrogenase family protein [Candidatus Thermoplasmatota archaeon]|jgi:butyryl-CoA dehydrogenase|nr:acyl-CoA dehydrogenase family protein [Candidatus Thermoplasmatota archaeon]
MDFQITPEQEMIRRTAREFVDKEVRPFVNEWEEKGEIPDRVVRRMGELGLLGAPIPEEYGGSGLDALTYAMITEEMGRGCSSLRTTISVNTSLCGLTILRHGTEAQKKQWLPKLCTAEKRGAWALSEPSAGSDAAGLQTTATRKGNKWVLSGRKLWISDGDRADVVVIYARDPSVQDRHKAIGAWLVTKGTPGFRAGSVWAQNKLGLRASHTAELVLEDVEVDDAAVIAAPGKGWDCAMDILNGGRLSVAAGAVGIAQAALEASIAYCQERKAFNRPIGHFQLVKEMIAEMAVDVEAGRNLVYKAAWKKANDMPHKLDVSMAKLFTAKMAMRVTENAVQIFGGIGYTTDVPVERYFRDAKICGIYEGTNQIQQIIIADEVLGLDA